MAEGPQRSSSFKCYTGQKVALLYRHASRDCVDIHTDGVRARSLLISASGSKRLFLQSFRNRNRFHAELAQDRAHFVLTQYEIHLDQATRRAERSLTHFSLDAPSEPFSDI